MATPILLPKQGNTVETCLILEWKKKKGDEIKKGEVICEIETDKAVFEIESPEAGIVLETFFEEGDDVPVFTNIAVVGSIGENFDEYSPMQNKSSVENDNSKEELISQESVAGENLNSISKEADETTFSEKKISPRAKKLADKLKLPFEKLEGTGPDERIIERDVLKAAKNYQNSTAATSDLVNKKGSHLSAENGGKKSDIESSGRPEVFNLEEENIKVVPLRGIRKIIAERMLESLKNSAQLTLNSSADARALLNLRKRFKSSIMYDDFQDVTINDLIHFAVVKTLPDHPELNSLLIGDSIEYYNRIHLGFAVDTPRGLMVPVIRNSHDMNLLQLSREAKRLASASISGKIEPEDLNDATFTVTNLGSYGIESFSPVLNLPQTGILGVNTISLKPIEIDNKIEFIPYVYFSLTIDHRAIDGAVGARFLQSLAKTINEIDLLITADTMG